jgi:hypothetical protein
MKLDTAVNVFIAVIVVAAVIGIVLTNLVNQHPNDCTADAMVCADGTAVGRDGNNNCEFHPCPELQSCGGLVQCPDGMDCYDFPDDSEGAYCYLGDPCMKCPSFECNIMESYPMQIACV